jgi:hypothetical protein
MLFFEESLAIADSFPALNLEQVYGAIAYYLANRIAVDKCLAAGKAEFARLRAESRQQHPSLHAKLDLAAWNRLTERAARGSR